MMDLLLVLIHKNIDALRDKSNYLKPQEVALNVLMEEAVLLEHIPTKKLEVAKNVIRHVKNVQLVLQIAVNAMKIIVLITVNVFPKISNAQKINTNCKIRTINALNA